MKYYNFSEIKNIKVIMNSFEELPPEILTKILYYLTPKDLLNTSKISNNLFEISQRVLKEKLLILKLNNSTNVLVSWFYLSFDFRASLLWMFSSLFFLLNQNI